MPATSPQPTIDDGRSARRDRNREAVLDAVLELFSEGSLAPAAQDVAARSGVSLRSVYRYYADMDGLARAAIARHVEKVQPLLEVTDLGDGPLPERAARIVERRLALYQAVAPTMRAALVLARRNQIVRDQIDANRRRLLEQVRRMFQPELRALVAPDRREVTAALDVLLGFESVEHLRHDRGFSAAATGRVLIRSVLALLGGPTAPRGAPR